MKKTILILFISLLSIASVDAFSQSKKIVPPHKGKYYKHKKPIKHTTVKYRPVKNGIAHHRLPTPPLPPRLRLPPHHPAPPHPPLPPRPPLPPGF